MRVTAIETIRVEAYPNITFVEIHTDEGISGLGETFRTPKAIAAQVHETVAHYLLGKNPLAIDAHSNVLLNPYLGFASEYAGEKWARPKPRRGRDRGVRPHSRRRRV